MPDAFSVHVSISAPGDIEVLQALGYEDHTWVTFPSDSEARVTVSVEDITQREDMEVRWRTGAGSEIGKMYFHELDGVGYFVHVFDPDPGLFGPSPIPKDFIFVMDKSGSMSGLKFAQSQVAMNFSYAHLSSSDRFSFVEFNSGFTTYSDDLLPATGENKAAIISHIMSLRVGGGTDIHSAVIEALDIFKAAGEPMPVIVLLSDGRANSGLYHRSEFRQDVLDQNTLSASIFCIALGNGADWPFLEALAIENDGRAIWVHENEDVITVIDDFVSSFSNAILADLSFEYGPDVYDVHPSRVRAHYEGSEMLVTGRISLDAISVSCKVTARSPEGDIVSEGLFPVEILPGNDFVPRFWAFQRIKDLEDKMKVNGPDNDTIDRIVDLATGFHFATDHTSLFVELPDDLKEQFYGDEEPN
jgi:Ca-activated chloride channel family protein